MVLQSSNVFSNGVELCRPPIERLVDDEIVQSADVNAVDLGIEQRPDHVCEPLRQGLPGGAAVERVVTGGQRDQRGGWPT